MKKFDTSLVITHVAYRKEPTGVAIEGPYSAISRSLAKIVKNVYILGIPLIGYEDEFFFGRIENTKKIRLPRIFGKYLAIKFIVDILLTLITTILWSIRNWDKKKLVIGIDPLSCLPLLAFKKLFGYTLIYHCVDFNKNRFTSKFLQSGYELADKWSSLFSDQTWVICDRLKDYKKSQYDIDSSYLPNSVIFDPSICLEGIKFRTGNKMIWTGSLLTNRQFDILFRVLSYIQTKVRPEMQYVLAPTKDHKKFEKYVKLYKIKKIKILRLNSRLEFQKVASRCDVGIALYDETFGSTEFIEPMKIWDFLLCGLPFVVSCEPSVSEPIKISGVAYFMQPKNTIPQDSSLKDFLSQNNLKNLVGSCLEIAKKFDIDKQVKARIDALLQMSRDQ